MTRAGTARAVVVASGVAAMAWGARGIVVEADRVHPLSFGKWFVGALVVHDFVIAPVVFFLASVVLSRVRPPYRACVQGGLVVSGTLVLVSIPVVGGYGRRADNTSTLPLDYGRNLLLLLGLVWIATFAVAAGQVLRGRRTAPVLERKHS